MQPPPPVRRPLRHRSPTTSVRALPRTLSARVLVGLLACVFAGAGGGSGASGAPGGDISAAGEGRWLWPVDGPRIVDEPFRAPPTPYAAGHRGVDLAARIAGPSGVAVVRAPLAGVVHFAGRVVDRGVVTVRAGVLLVTVEPVTPSVVTGDAVTAGQVLGALEPGHCAAPCVHLGVREAGQYLSPMRWLGGLHRAVLLPLERTDR